MKHITGLWLLIALTSCAPSKEELSNLKSGEVISVMNLRVKMDNNEETSFKNQCGVMAVDEAGKEFQARKDRDTGYYVMKTAPGKIMLTKIGCRSNRVFYNKHRVMDLKDIYFITTLGYINYVGDINVEWDSDRLNAGDIILGMGGLIPDEGTIHIGLQDRLDAAKQYMAQEYPTINQPFKRSLLADNPIITR